MASLLVLSPNLAAPNSAERAIVLIDVLQLDQRIAISDRVTRARYVPITAYEIETKRRPFS
jgi:hypothetical protein